MADCCCLEIEYFDIALGSTVTQTMTIEPDHLNGFCVYSFIISTGETISWWNTGNLNWYLDYGTPGVVADKIGNWRTDDECPITEGSSTLVSFIENPHIDYFTTRACLPCCCLEIEYFDVALGSTVTQTMTIETNSLNGYCVYSFTISTGLIVTFWNSGDASGGGDPDTWYMVQSLAGSFSNRIAFWENPLECPITEGSAIIPEMVQLNAFISSFTTRACPPCCCLEMQYLKYGDSGTWIIAPLVVEQDEYNDRCVYTVIIDGVTLYWWYEPSNTTWVLSTILGSKLLINVVATWENSILCPATEGSSDPVYTDIGGPLLIASGVGNMLTRECTTPCDCILIGYLDPLLPYSESVESSGLLYNNRPVYVFIFDGITYYIWFYVVGGPQNLALWVCTTLVGDFGSTFASSVLIPSSSGCPIGLLWTESKHPFSTEQGTCICVPIEERIFKEYQSIKLPEIFEEENRGFFKCCEPQIVLASTTSTDTWKNDISSAWIKLSDPSDSATILLTKDGQPTSYPISIITFPNEPNAIYRTIYWRDVLSSDGEGCYKIEIAYTIGGMTGNFTWGTYDLKEYSIERALGTARIRVLLNLKQQIEDINFTDSLVEDTIRFYGFIGNRQPNMEIDNLIYQSRIVKSVVRENLDTYEINTDPYTDETIRRLTDLYLLSENDMFISDYNAFNNSYRINDVPVIVQDSPEIDYLDKLQRKAILTCVVGDKTKNKRTYY